ncbi:CUE domain-containing protein 1-like isoform X2 [Ptychodera flava]|uniref:CUE domain-containing protein 1-like isoform X2 n=1 Tax=Ptychodera flava TaxID=63121 RepID=UPI00396A3FC8
MAMAPESQPPNTGKSKKNKFRRSSSGPPNNATANNMVSPPSKQLEFHQAMTDFKTMFPKMDHDVIEAVLRANNGAVDATIDQLLVMNVDMQQEDSRHGFVDDNTIPPEVFEPTSDDDEPPPAYTPHARPDSVAQQDPTPPYTPPATGTPLPASPQMTTPPSRPYRSWNPPLLGSLPDDFLRMGVGSSPGSPSQQSMATPQLQKQLEQNRQQRSEIDKDDVEMKQRLDDEELAIMLQNEEFLRELQTSPEFIASLERDQRATLGGGVSSLSSHDPQLGVGAHGATAGAYGTSQQGSQVEDADFKDKLSHMGKSTKKKFAQLAKRFQRKKKRSAKASLHESAAAPSTANLLEDIDDDLDDEDEDDERMKRERLSQADDNDIPNYQLQMSPYRRDQTLILSNDHNNEAIV